MQQSKFACSWSLAKLSLGVLVRNKELLAFPILTFIFSIFIVALFLAPITLVQSGYSITQPEHWEAVRGAFFSKAHTLNGQKSGLQLTVSGWLYWIVLYLSSMFVVTFANVAFYHEILNALRGGSVSVSRGLAFAASRWKSILLWTLFAGAIGIIIRSLEERVAFIGRIIIGLIGAAWSVACIFVIPTMVQENASINPFNMLKTSAQTLRRTWGETVIGYVGLTLGNLIITIASIVLIIGAVGASIYWQTIWIGVIVGFLWLVALFAYAYVMGVASQIYRGALFLYASEGYLANGFTPELMASSWRFKKP